MGICPSKYHAPYKYFPTLIEFRKTFECLGVTEREVGQLYKHFRTIDVDDSGDVELAEVLVHLHVEKTFFNRRVFGLLDVDASGQLNFEEFMVGLWNYCSVEDEFFEHFAFDLYDTDGSGNIDIEEAQYMIKDIYGEEFEHNVFAKRAHKKLAELDIERLDFKSFVDFSHNHRAMLYPAFSLQMSLKKYIMGAAFWHRQAIHRLQLCEGQYRTITDIIGKKDFHKKRKLIKRKSDLINMFRRASTTNEEGTFTLPGTAYNIPGSTSFSDHPAKRRGSKTQNHHNETDQTNKNRRGSKDKSHESPVGRRGSKTISIAVDPLHGLEKAGAGRTPKASTPLASTPDTKGRRGSLNMVTAVDSLMVREKAGGRRGSDGSLTASVVQKLRQTTKDEAKKCDNDKRHSHDKHSHNKHHGHDKHGHDKHSHDKHHGHDKHGHDKHHSPEKHHGHHTHGHDKHHGNKHSHDKHHHTDKKATPKGSSVHPS